MKKLSILIIIVTLFSGLTFAQKAKKTKDGGDTLRVPAELVIRTDGTSDAFTIEGLEKYKNVKFSIYDEVSTKVFETENYNETNNWKPKDMPTGNYFYFLEFSDKAPANAKKKELSGKVRIINKVEFEEIDSDPVIEEVPEEDDED
ncbi:MAG: gliding motility-associated C-terminal domain-containing protein [Bacteroidetes bacterium]|nr:gliding motility-associated C-terminal domain-containing protein [Bacteroidota bacterium]MBU1719170.1 gliding motility-associated C-terminal domain-containing protein [Bacteroidota bacterium]